VVDDEVVLDRLFARVLDQVDLGAGQACDEAGQVDDPMHLGGLVKIRTRSPRSGGLAMVSSTHRTVSRMWMNARVWPPVPWTGQRVADRGLHEERLSTVP